MKTTEATKYINEYIGATIYCKGGVALLHGCIVNETAKAVKIDYSIEPVFASGCAANINYDRTAWIPKSQVKAVLIDGTTSATLEITAWFANNAMKSYRKSI
jgi:hypothetical protein